MSFRPDNRFNRGFGFGASSISIMRALTSNSLAHLRSLLASARRCGAFIKQVSSSSSGSSVNRRAPLGFPSDFMPSPWQRASDKIRPRLSVVTANLFTITLCAFTISSNAQTNAPAKSTNQFKAKPAAATPVKVSEPTKIKIISIDGALSTNLKCQTSIGQIYLAGLPVSVKADHDLFASLEKHIPKENESIRVEFKRIRDTRAKLPTNYEYESPAWFQAQQLSKDYELADNRREDLNEAERKFTEAKKQFNSSRHITAVDTGRVYGVIPVWQVVATNVATPNSPAKSVSK